MVRGERKVIDMRRFLLNGSVMSALTGGWSAVQATRKGPRDWRLALLWIIWVLSVAIAIGTVVKDHESKEIER